MGAVLRVGQEGTNVGTSGAAGLTPLRGGTKLPRRIVGYAARRLQGWRLYRAMARRARRGLTIVKASSLDMERIGRRLDPAGVPWRPADGQTDWVAKRGERITGFVQLLRDGDESCAPSGYWLSSLTVFAPYRGRGIGELLTRHVIEQARNEGAQELLLTVFDDNLRALTLYRKLGFKPILIPELQPAFENDGRQCGPRVATMSKPLGPGL